ncbi:MAG: gamma-glutamyltransferase [Planctomycetaceae bacterium]|nr:gamma-glutamyltransferase [Planctomycetaceae bacterium]
MSCLLPDRRSLTALSCALIILNGLLPGQQAAAQTTASFEHGVVAADHQAASQAGAEMLRRGGNVVDAAIATSFALSVVRPASCGVGGGGFMVIWNAERQQAVAIDYRERAPAASSRDMFSTAGPGDDRESGSVRGGRACGIPGTVAGLCLAAREYGTLPLKTLLEPAIRLAEQGVTIDQHDISVQASTLARLRRYPDYEKKFAALKKHYLNNGVIWQAGDRFHSPQLPLLKKLAAEGERAFYEGEVAMAIVSASREQGGVLTLDDLASTKVPVIRQPLSGEFHGFSLLAMPPASSGGVALLQTLNTLQHWERDSGRSLASLGHNSADYVHVVTEAMKHAFADRAEYLGDSDFVDVPIERLISNDYAARIASRIDMTRTLPPEAYGRFFGQEDGGTSHFSVVDSHGNAVACTETINTTFASFVVVPEWGILLNNQIDDFAARPGEPNVYGLMQSEANTIAPGKKPLSSMTPMIVVKDGRAVFSAGASGGPRIISATLQVTLNHLVFGQPPAVAVNSPRFHHQWAPNVIRLEPDLHAGLQGELGKRGHKVVASESLAASQAVAQKSGVSVGGSDKRKHGQPAGH